MSEPIWYFDYISPFAYLQFASLGRLLPAGFEYQPRPVLFAAFLQEHGHKGPAEIPSKRVHTYTFSKWYADTHGIPFKMPPSHPFNPIHLLRLTLALGNTPEAIRTIFDFVWAEGQDPADPAAMKSLAARLGVDDLAAATGAQEVKDRLRANVEEASGNGIFGVPTFHIDGHNFWGVDATPMMLDYVANPGLFDTPEMQRIATMPMGIKRD